MCLGLRKNIIIRIIDFMDSNKKFTFKKWAIVLIGIIYCRISFGGEIQCDGWQCSTFNLSTKLIINEPEYTSESEWENKMIPR